MNRRTLLRGVVGTGVLLTTGAGSPGRAHARGIVLPVRSCADWGARPASQAITVVPRRPVRILVHHTASDNVEDYSLDAACAQARWIQHVHMDQNGWLDSGQHFTNSRGGYLLEGRHQSLDALRAGDHMIQGAHCPGQNEAAIGIENEGTYVDAEPPTPQWETLVSFCVYACDQYGISPREIFGHRDFYADTVCPGDRFYAMLPRLRREVAAVLG
ncbi:peptidoglycan recognition protein family protein [Umezawaea beigongshangensis]|uniref:peptidoglycan recognition protein family protein n=1 Tax=Umezawaea beigongshangensis TaxID=2780383 RepID=UPI0018F1157F|nr:peptidoglycan recognition family protein [Umezawaea beigongshangensis]